MFKELSSLAVSKVLLARDFFPTGNRMIAFTEFRYVLRTTEKVRNA